MTKRNPDRETNATSRSYIEGGPRGLDIICGIGVKSMTKDHVGNKRYEKIVENFRSDYRKRTQTGKKPLKKKQKTKLIKNVIDTLLKEGSRFVQYDKVARSWFLVREKAIHEKVSFCLRDSVPVVDPSVKSSETISVDDPPVGTTSDNEDEEHQQDAGSLCLDRTALDCCEGDGAHVGPRRPGEKLLQDREHSLIRSDEDTSEISTRKRRRCDDDGGDYNDDGSHQRTNEQEQVHAKTKGTKQKRPTARNKNDNLHMLSTVSLVYHNGSRQQEPDKREDQNTGSSLANPSGRNDPSGSDGGKSFNLPSTGAFSQSNAADLGLVKMPALPEGTRNHSVMNANDTTHPIPQQSDSAAFVNKKSRVVSKDDKRDGDPSFVNLSSSSSQTPTSYSANNKGEGLFASSTRTERESIPNQHAAERFVQYPTLMNKLMNIETTKLFEANEAMGLDGVPKEMRAIHEASCFPTHFTSLPQPRRDATDYLCSMNPFLPSSIQNYHQHEQVEQERRILNDQRVVHPRQSSYHSPCEPSNVQGSAILRGGRSAGASGGTGREADGGGPAVVGALDCAAGSGGEKENSSSSPSLRTLLRNAALDFLIFDDELRAREAERMNKNTYPNIGQLDLTRFPQDSPNLSLERIAAIRQHANNHDLAARTRPDNAPFRASEHYNNPTTGQAHIHGQNMADAGVGGSFQTNAWETNRRERTTCSSRSQASTQEATKPDAAEERPSPVTSSSPTTEAFSSNTSSSPSSSHGSSSSLFTSVRSFGHNPITSTVMPRNLTIPPQLFPAAVPVAHGSMRQPPVVVVVFPGSVFSR